jgi:polyphosphate glucokinase
MELVLGLDLGGSSIKAGAVDPATGQVVGPLDSIPTPAGATVEATEAALKELIGRFPQCQGPVGLAFPSVVVRGGDLQRGQHRQGLDRL